MAAINESGVIQPWHEMARIMRGGVIARKAKALLEELDANYLEVVLIPSRDPDCAMRGGKIRAVQYQNAEWYRKFCGEHESNRNDRLRWLKFKTKIKRAHTRRALKELISGKCLTPYAVMLTGFIQRWEVMKKDERRAA
jgi:hypothetical protein